MAVVVAHAQGHGIVQGDVTNGFRTVVRPQIAFWSGDDNDLQTLVSVEYVGQNPPKFAYYAPRRSLLGIALWDGHGKLIHRRLWPEAYTEDAASDIVLNTQPRIFMPSKAIHETAAFFNVIDEFDVRSPGAYTLTVEVRIYLHSGVSEARLLKLPTVAVPIVIPKVDSPPLLGPSGAIIAALTVILLTSILCYLRCRRVPEPGV
jgi:hypothetical protein